MLKYFAWFEVRYWLRGWMLWIFLLIIGGLVFAAVSTGGVLAIGNTNRNSPFDIQQFYSMMCLLTLLMVTAFVNSAAGRDFAHNHWQILFTKPLSKSGFLGGRFLGSTLIAVVPMLGISLGFLLAKYMPWASPDGWGPVDWGAHLKSILVFAIPNTLFIAAIIFAIAVLTRSTLTSFLGALLLLTAYIVSLALMSDLSQQTTAALLDPFAIRTFDLMTKYWTVADKNHLSIGFTGMMLWNRLIWLLIGAAIFALACLRFRFEERSWWRRKPAPAEREEPSNAAVALPPVRPAAGPTARWAQFCSSFRIEFLGLVKSTAFIVIAAAALLLTISNLFLTASEGYGNTPLPVTYRILGTITNTLFLFVIAIITYYAGALVWKDRDTGMDEIHDASPHPVWPDYAAKIGALLGTIFVIECIALVAGVLSQAFHGYYRFQFGLYASDLLLMNMPPFLFLSVLMFFIHVIAPNKYVGYFIFIVLLIANNYVWGPLRVDTLMVKFGQLPDYTYSDFYGYGPFLQGRLWFSLYWLAFCGLLVLATVLFWQRGRETGWRQRLRNARLRFTPRFRYVTVACLLTWLAVGGWVFYNTRILNRMTGGEERRDISAGYEKTYKRFENLPQPRIRSVRYEIDLRPETRKMTMRGDEVLQNETSGPIPEIHVSVTRDFTGNIETDTEIDGASLVKNDRRLSYRIYRLATPMQPGESRHMRFTVRSRNHGFENSVSDTSILQNGTFFNNGIAPQIGYQVGSEVTDREARKKRGLKERDPMPALERNCVEHCRDNYFTRSDWVSVESVISTAPDQIAVGPGSLIREWAENGRRYFQYRLDHDSLNFYSFVSGRYVVARTEWNGFKIEVYYLKDHTWNVPRMLRSIQRSLEYYTTNFGPYLHKQARIIEFPRGGGAQSYPGTMPYSEGIGFIANLEHPDDIDQVFYVVAHEMAHQWWAHQVAGAYMQGARLLSETLSQYSALMVMEKEYGRNMMRKFLEYEMNEYLRGRGREMVKEQPLERVEGQGYVCYQKGSVVMYYLKEMIGEEAVNRALRKVVRQYAYAPPPYPTAYALVDALKAETPESLRYLIKDLFEDITLFANRTVSASARKRADGKYDITIEVQSQKFKADGKGNEKEVPVNDWIEIGAFAKPLKGNVFGALLHRERVHMTQPRGTYTFTVDALPDKAGIDPLLLMIDRIPDDNLKKVEIGGRQ